MIARRNVVLPLIKKELEVLMPKIPFFKWRMAVVVTHYLYFSTGDRKKHNTNNSFCKPKSVLNNIGTVDRYTYILTGFVL